MSAAENHGSMVAPGSPALEIRDLRTEISDGNKTTVAVDSVSFAVRPGEILGLVGESGCGKTMTALSIMGLLPPGGAVVGGSVKLDGRELVELADQELCKVRGDQIGMVFQDPMNSLNPTKRVGEQVAETVRLHRALDGHQARARAIEVMRAVGLPGADDRYDSYPYQLSGGMRQRVMIASAIACNPKVLIADEPTTALDVTIQAQIITLLDDLRHRLGMAVVIITHDFGVVARIADRVAVMYAGQIVEEADARRLFLLRRHPYTDALFHSIPTIHGPRMRRLAAIDGLPPDLASPQRGCRFAPRCRWVQEDCRASAPTLQEAEGAAHLVRCFHPLDAGEGRPLDGGAVGASDGEESG